MINGIKKVLVLEGLGCANCAAKIEKEVGNLPEVKSASVDFVSKRLVIEVIHSSQLDDVIEKASKIAVRIESGIRVVEENKQNEQPESPRFSKKKLIQFGTGTVFFIAALILKQPFWVEFGIYLTGYVLVGGEVLLKAARNILRGQVFDENFLMTVATIGAFAVGEFPEGVAVMLFYQVGEFFQDIAVNHSRKSIAALMDIRPDYANLKQGDEIRRVSPEEVSIGDIIIVKPGEKVPLDGTVVDGRSMLDTSALTGESVPIEAEAGSGILSGSINKNGLLTVKVSKSFSESTVSKILDLVQNASSKKAKTENFITKFARYYTPAVVFSAAAIAVIPPLIMKNAAFSDWILRALTFLVVSCPCALVISIPLGFFGGIGGASRNGILVKGSNYIEALNKAEILVFDKTGTLTEGVFKVSKVHSFDSSIDLLEYAAYAESYSSHPIALSILGAYNREIEKSEITEYNEISGFGIKATIKGRVVFAGNSKLMSQEGVDYEETDETGTIVHVAVDGNYAGNIIIADVLKADSRKAIKELKGLNIKKLVMLTGDSKRVGDAIGRELGLDEVHSELLPDQKVEELEKLEKQKSPKGKLVFVGDGINDAPVLARADIGIAMGALGSDAAIEAADIVLMTDEPSKIASAIRIARRTRNIVWQNIIFAIAVKILVLILTAGGISTMWEAVFADVGVALLAILNAMRVMRTDGKR